MKQQSSHNNRQGKGRPKVAKNQHRSNKSTPKSKNLKNTKSPKNHKEQNTYLNQNGDAKQRKEKSVDAQPKKKLKHISKEEKIRREHITNSKLLPMFVFFMITIYLFGQLFMMATSKSSVGLETVVLGTLDSLEEYEGIAVRQEYVATASEEGHVEYTFSEGDKIPKDVVVAIVRDEATTDTIEEKILQIDQDILKTQKNRTDLSLFAEDIARIDQTIQQIVTQNMSYFMGESMESIYDVKSRVQSSMNQRNEIWFTEDISSISQLTSQKFQYETELAENTVSITALESGVLSFSYDGLEDVITVDEIDSITESQIGADHMQNISTDQIVDEGEEIFKIVTNNKWYIVAYLPNTVVTSWKEEQIRTVTLKNGNSKIPIKCTVKTIQTGDNKSKVVLATYERVDMFMNQRQIILYPEVNVTEGLKIPKSAMVEKNLWAIPKTALTQSGKDYGVVLKDGERFVPVSVATSDNIHNYITPTDTLKTGDVIINGSDEFEIGNTVPVAGVYSANSSIAKFTFIEIIEQNNEYAIAKYGNTYGLQPYDVIISDAKNIIEGQELY